MRVLHVSTWKTPCGIATYADQLVSHLAAIGIENDVFPLRQAEMRKMRPAKMRQLWDSLAQDAKNADVVHIQHEFGLYAPGKPFRRTLFNFHQMLKSIKSVDRPFVCTFHTDPPLPENRPHSIRGMIRRAALNAAWHYCMARNFAGDRRQARALVHTSKTLEAYLNAGFDPKTIEIMPHGCPVRSNVTTYGVEAARARLGIPDDKFVLSIFGFVSSYKGYRTAIQALEHLPDDTFLLVVGGGHPENHSDNALEFVLRAARRLGRERMLLTGFADRETINLANASTDLYLAPYDRSTTLSASGAITWMLTSGRPVVASSLPTFVDIHERGECLALTRPNMPRELAWTIEKLRADQVWQQRLVQRAKTFTSENSWSVVASRTADLYGDLIARRERPGDEVEIWRAEAA